MHLTNIGLHHSAYIAGCKATANLQDNTRSFAERIFFATMLTRQHRHCQQLTKLKAAIRAAATGSVSLITKFCSIRTEGDHLHRNTPLRQQRSATETLITPYFAALCVEYVH